jgi:hypothetical protein
MLLKLRVLFKLVKFITEPNGGTDFHFLISLGRQNLFRAIPETNGYVR